MASERGRVAMRLHAVAIRLLRTLRAEDARTGMGPARLSVLSILVFAGPRTLGELATAEQVSAPTMTRLVAALEADGYVRRMTSPEDGRVVIAQATARARRLLRAARARRVRRLEELTAGLSAREWRELERVVARLEEVLAR